MVLDHLDRIERYRPLHHRFHKAIGFLRQAELESLPLGRREIDGDRIYAMVCKDPARTRDEAKLEAHRRYIDIQVVLSGVDEMGWKSRPLCEKIEAEYDAETDFELLADAPDAWTAVGPGAFAIFFPEDAHAPLVGVGELHKIVVKVAVD